MLIRNASLVLVSAFAVACGSVTVTSGPGAGGAGGATVSSSDGGAGGGGATSTAGSTSAVTSVTSSTGVGGGTPCLDVEVNTEPNGGVGGGVPSAPCEITLPAIIADVDLDSLHVEIHFVDAASVVLHRVGDLGGCLDDPEAYYLADGLLQLCPATCETLEDAAVSLMTVTGECLN